MTGGDHLERELALVKLRLAPEQRENASRQVQAAGGHVLSAEPESYIVELTSSEAEVTRFVADLARTGELLEVVRSGALGISRRARSLHIVADV